ncbi:MAG: PQQ-binding-like beta-propeller repeat protein [Pirellulales bacterium]
MNKPSLLRSVRSHCLRIRAWPLYLCLLSAAAAGADWRQFRGNDNTGAGPAGSLPVEWSVPGDEAGGAAKSKNIAWQADLPGRGVSSPIVVGGKVIVTASSGIRQDRLHVLAFDVETGQLAWERQFWATGHTSCHPTMAVAAPTPASDGEHVFAFYSSNDMVALDLDGNLQWVRGLTHDFPAAANDVGMAASPVVIGDTLVVQVENKGESFAAGLDTATGQTRWQHDRDKQMNWTSPAVLRGKGPADDAVLLQSPSRLTAHHPRTGEQLWAYPAGCSVIPSVVAAEGTVFLPTGGLTALRPPSGSQAAEVLWTQAKLGPGSASPLIDQGRVYALNNGGVLTCGDAATGEELWRLRLAGPFWATPIAAGGHIYCVNEKGLAQVVRPQESEGELVARNDFGEPILASPAADGHALYFRSDAHLWKIEGR